MIIKDNMANMCAKVTSTYMEFTLAFGPKPEFSFSFKFFSTTHGYILSLSNENATRSYSKMYQHYLKSHFLTENGFFNK